MVFGPFGSSKNYYDRAKYSKPGVLVHAERKKLLVYCVYFCLYVTEVREERGKMLVLQKF